MKRTKAGIQDKKIKRKTKREKRNKNYRVMKTNRQVNFDETMKRHENKVFK